MNIICAVKKNSSCSNLSCSVVNAVVFVSCLFLELHISWVVVLTVNPPIYKGWNFNFGNTMLDWIQALLE